MYWECWHFRKSGLKRKNFLKKMNLEVAITWVGLTESKRQLQWGEPEINLLKSVSRVLCAENWCWGLTINILCAGWKNGATGMGRTLPSSRCCTRPSAHSRLQSRGHWRRHTGNRDTLHWDLRKHIPRRCSPVLGFYKNKIGRMIPGRNKRCKAEEWASNGFWEPQVAPFVPAGVMHSKAWAWLREQILKCHARGWTLSCKLSAFK